MNIKYKSESGLFCAFAMKTFGVGGIMFSGVSLCECVCASRKPCEHYISKTTAGNFAQFWSQMYLGSRDAMIRF